MVRRLCSLNTQFSSQYRMLATINERLGVLNGTGMLHLVT